MEQEEIHMFSNVLYNFSSNVKDKISGGVNYKNMLRSTE